MNLTTILGELRNKRTRIEKAIAAIESLNHSTGIRGRVASRDSTPKRRRHRISAAARRKLSLLMKRRWAQGRMGKKSRTEAAWNL
jgi:hypothetical protein